MARTTKKQVENAFGFFCECFGFRQADSWNDVGGLRLDYNGIYGGYVIEEVHNASGGVSHPFGSMRMKAGPFCDALHFAVLAGEAKLPKRKKRK